MNGAQGRVGGPDLAENIVVYVQGVLLILITLIGLLMFVACVGSAVLHIVLPDCPTEDSVNCYWGGGENGEGAKFFDINGFIIPVEFE